MKKSRNLKTLFPGYHPLDSQDYQAIWQDAYFILDTNVLLNLYRYSEKTRKEFIELLKADSIKNRIWIPHQVAYEYSKNRLDTISFQQQAYKSIQDDLAELIISFQNKTLQKYKRHPFVNSSEIHDKLSALANEISRDLEKKSILHIESTQNDVIYDTLLQIFDGKIGEALKDVKVIYQEADKRYEAKTPPGYSDTKNKNGVEKYGDFLIWRQILDFAKLDTKRSIIFVSDDSKEDWWRIFRGKTIGPRPELVQEILEEAGCMFHMYNSDGFFEYFSEHIKKQVEAEILEEIKNVRLQQESFSRASVTRTLYLHLNSLIRLFKQFVISVRKNPSKVVENTYLMSRMNEILREISNSGIRVEQDYLKKILLPYQSSESITFASMISGNFVDLDKFIADIEDFLDKNYVPRARESVKTAAESSDFEFPPEEDLPF
jgi:hypothetical protein